MRRVVARDLASALGAGRGDLVSLVGAGGKTTALYRLTAEWTSRGLTAAAATTTKIAVPGPEDPCQLLCAESYEGLAVGIARHRSVVLGRRVLASRKVEGIPPEWCDRLLAEGRVEALAVEADGAGRRPVKAPEAWEPVVPAATTVFVPVLGLSGVGLPLTEAHAFRVERIAAVTGLRAGAAMTVAAFGALLTSAQGLLKGLPHGARVVVLLNQADLPGARAVGEAVAGEVLSSSGPIDRVVVAALQTPSPVREVWKR
ncbi:MAG: putative selenium-dependent hydroxylase accessory protein YqeC [Deltaproteobacteria bacterium]|nr:putative selenium-dependent hydroxylase accessory protein YqeC [Deltaproteobacteria bacterium]